MRSSDAHPFRASELCILDVLPLDDQHLAPSPRANSTRRHRATPSRKIILAHQHPAEVTGPLQRRAHLSRSLNATRWRKKTICEFARPQKVESDMPAQQSPPTLRAIARKRLAHHKREGLAAASPPSQGHRNSRSRAAGNHRMTRPRIPRGAPRTSKSPHEGALESDREKLTEIAPRPTPNHSSPRII
jgi:hypothetical protein